MWSHMETFHELMQPTYMSKYPPAEALALTPGIWLGVPLLGAIVSVALGCAATTWMLQAWLPSRRALLGGLIAASMPMVFGWSQNYWGGGVGMIGGALLIGATVRAWRRNRDQGPARWRQMGIIVGIALALLAMSRPFEGAVLTILLLAVTAFRSIRSQPIGDPRRLAIWSTIVLIPAGLWMGYYNWRITGNALLTPYALHEKQYAAAPIFWWGHANPDIAYRNPEMREFYIDQELPTWRQSHSVRGWIALAIGQMRQALLTLVQPLTLAIPIIYAILYIRPRTRHAPASGLVVALRFCLIVSASWFLIHFIATRALAPSYLSPILPLLVACVVISMRSMMKWRVGRLHAGRSVVAGVALAQLWTLASLDYAASRNPSAPGQTRARLVQMLSQLPRKQLVLVHYEPGAELKTLFEWVYNEPDPDSSRVVFAHQMNPVADHELMQYYRDRQCWQLEVDGSQLHLEGLQGAP